MKQNWQVLLYAACVIFLGPTLALSQMQTCVTNPQQGGPEICVGWDAGIVPQQPAHFEVSFSNPSFPEVQLKQTQLTWRVWSLDPDNPAGIGDIGVISSPVAQNFGVKIEGPGSTPGARHCHGIVLDPTGTSNYSRVLGGRITGNLTGDFTVERSSGGTGGDATFTIDGFAYGIWTVPTVTGAGVTIGVLDGQVQINKEMNGNFKILSMGPNSQVSIADWVSGVIELGDSNDFGGDPIGGDILLTKGIEIGQIVTIFGELTSTGSVDLKGKDLAGELNLYDNS